jgi:NitT/TauT family transport system substrate-binding protein
MARLSAAVLAALLVIAFVAGTGTRRAQAQAAPIDVAYGTLGPSSSEWPIYIGLDQHFFSDEGLNLSIVYLGSPPNVVNGIATNAVALANNGPDSYIAAISHGLPIKIVGLTYAVNPYSLVVQPSVKSFADLKGQPVSLGTGKDVTAMVLSQMAVQHQMTLGDFSIVLGGTSAARYAALTSGAVAGTILSQPFDLLAVSQGMHILATAHDAMPDWTFAVYAVNAPWAAANRPTIEKMLRAIRRSIRYGYAHKDDAIRLLVANTKVSPDIAAQTYDLTFTKWHAFHDDLVFPQRSLDYIEKKQVEIGGLVPPVPTMAQLYDPSFANEAGH